MNINRLLVGWATRAQQRIDQASQSIGFADDDIGVFAKLGVIELALQQLRRAADTTKRILYLVRKLANHLPTRAVLYQQRVLTTNTRSARYIGYFNQQGRVGKINRRYTAVNNTLFRVYFGRTETHFIGIMIARPADTTQDILQFGFIINQAQQRFAARASGADTENIFRRGIQSDDQQAAVQQDDARTQAIQNIFGVGAERSVIAGTPSRTCPA